MAPSFHAESSVFIDKYYLFDNQYRLERPGELDIYMLLAQVFSSIIMLLG